MRLADFPGLKLKNSGVGELLRFSSACLVAIMAQGPKHHCVVQAEIESILEREHAPAPVVSSAGALVDALHALGACADAFAFGHRGGRAAEWAADASAATATTWAILRALKLEPEVPGAGGLLRSAAERVA